HGLAPGNSFRHAIWFSVSRAMESAPRPASRHAVLGYSRAAFCECVAESRSGGQFNAWPSWASTHFAGTLAGADGAATLSAGNAPVVHGAGVHVVETVSLFLRS